MTRSSDLCFDRLLLAFQFVDPVLQRIDLPHQVFDRGLLPHSRASHHRCCQDTNDEGTGNLHVRLSISLADRLTALRGERRSNSDQYARKTCLLI